MTPTVNKVTDNPQPVTPRDESSSVSTAATASDRMDEPVTSTSMSVSVVQKMEPATELADEEAEGKGAIDVRGSERL